MGDNSETCFELQILDDFTDFQFNEEIKEISVANADGTLHSLSCMPGLFDVDIHAITQDIGTPKALPATRDVHCELSEFLLFSNVKKDASHRSYVLKSRKPRVLASKLARYSTRGHVRASNTFCNCNIDANQFTDPKLHYITEVAMEHNFKCTHCSRMFVDTEDFKYHLQTHQGDGSCKCRFCGSSFPTVTDVLVHQNTHQRIHRCAKCKKIFSREYNLFVHKKKVHGSVSRCLTCKKHFPFKSNLLLHESSTHSYDAALEQKKVLTCGASTCDICGVTFESISLKDEHIALCRPKSKLVQRSKAIIGERFKCEVCNSGYKRKPHLDRHRLRMHGIPLKEIKYQCKECDQIYFTFNSLQRHVRSHTQSTQKSVFSCANCFKPFTTKKNVLSHMRACHQAEANKQSCSVCEKKIGFYLMENHMRTHKLLNRYECKWCTRSFSKGSNLIRHARSLHKQHVVTSLNDCLYNQLLENCNNRESVRPVKYTGGVSSDRYHCNQCAKSYTTTANLLRHFRMVHKEVNPRTWRDCGIRPSEGVRGVNYDMAGNNNKENVPISSISSVAAKSKSSVKAGTTSLAPRGVLNSIDVNSPLSRKVRTPGFPIRQPPRIGALSRHTISFDKRFSNTPSSVSVGKSHRMSSNKVASLRQPASVSPSSQRKIRKQIGAQRVSKATVVPTSPRRQSNRLSTLCQQTSEAASQLIPETVISPTIKPVTAVPSPLKIPKQIGAQRMSKATVMPTSPRRQSNRLSTLCQQTSEAASQPIPETVISPTIKPVTAVPSPLESTDTVDRNLGQATHSRTVPSTETSNNNRNKNTIYAGITTRLSTRQDSQRSKQNNCPWLDKPSDSFQPGRGYLCTHCNKSLTSMYHYRVHMELFHSSRTYCKICDMTFSDSHKLKIHDSRAHSPILKKKFACNLCDKKFTQPRTLREHMDIHANKTSMCNECGKSFATWSYLLKHMRCMHPEVKKPIAEPSFCITCKRHFKSKESLASHLKTKSHYDYKTRVKCDSCGNTYANKVSLQLHTTHSHPIRKSNRNVSPNIKERLETPTASDPLIHFEQYATESKLKVSLIVIDLKRNRSNSTPMTSAISISYVDPIASEE